MFNYSTFNVYNDLIKHKNENFINFIYNDLVKKIIILCVMPNGKIAPTKLSEQIINVRRFTKKLENNENYTFAKP